MIKELRLVQRISPAKVNPLNYVFSARKHQPLDGAMQK
jgi:hypothetical protein